MSPGAVGVGLGYWSMGVTWSTGCWGTGCHLEHWVLGYWSSPIALCVGVLSVRIIGVT